MLKDRAVQHLNVLVNEIGERPAGRSAHHRAEAYIRQVYSGAGLHVDDVSVDFPNWTLHHASLFHGTQPLDVDVNPFSPSCEVRAPFVPLSTLHDLREAELSSKVALLYGELSKAPIFPINFTIVQFERDQTINRLLIEKEPLAVLAVNLHPWRRVHIFEDEDFPLPSATISAETGRALLLNPQQSIELCINTQTEPSHATTLVGRTRDDHAQRLVVCAHYDTKIGTPGAHDNGASMAVVLALAEELSSASVGLDFVAWGDEEYGAHTDSGYIEWMGERLRGLRCAINLDGLGLITENTTLTQLAGDDAFEKRVRAVAERYPHVVWVDPWVQSNHSSYALRGVPSIALSSLTWERSHQASDTINWISPDKLAEAGHLVRDLITEFRMS